MNTFETIKIFLSEGGKCLLIENGKPIGVVLTVEEYELLKSKLQITRSQSLSDSFGGQTNDKLQTKPDLPPQTPPYQGGDKGEVASADLADIALAGDVTLEDLGLDELPY